MPSSSDSRPRLSWNPPRSRWPDHARRSRLVVTGIYADGTVRDLTAVRQLSSSTAPGRHIVGINGVALVSAEGRNDEIRGEGAADRGSAPFDKPHPVSFRNDVIAALNVGGCNAGACHGTPTGKNGFKLSLRGYDPAADYIQLTRDVLGRRTDRQHPVMSLMMQKALGRVPHEGGSRFAVTSVPAQAMLGWIGEGLQDDAPTLPAVTKVDVLPGSRVLNEPSRRQQLAVIAHFADGSVRDVTRLTVFTSSDPAIANVNAERPGRVRPVRRSRHPVPLPRWNWCRSA